MKNSRLVERSNESFLSSSIFYCFLIVGSGQDEDSFENIIISVLVIL